MNLIKASLLLIVALVLVALLLPPAFILRTLRGILRKDSLPTYLITCAIGLDQLGSAVLYAEEDWTVSSMTYEKSIAGNVYATGFMRLIDFFAFTLGGQVEHCKNSYFNEIQKIKSMAK